MLIRIFTIDRCRQFHTDSSTKHFIWSVQAVPQAAVQCSASEWIFFITNTQGRTPLLIVLYCSPWCTRAASWASPAWPGSTTGPRPERAWGRGPRDPRPVPPWCTALWGVIRGELQRIAFYNTLNSPGASALHDHAAVLGHTSLKCESVPLSYGLLKLLMWGIRIRKRIIPTSVTKPGASWIFYREGKLSRLFPSFVRVFWVEYLHASHPSFGFGTEIFLGKSQWEENISPTC